MDPLVQLLEFSSIFLVVPVAIMLGHWRLGGTIVVSGAAALAASIIFWILLGGTTSLTGVGAVNSVVAAILEVGGVVLLVAAWTLSINGAATSRSWLWVFLLVVVGYISFAAQVIAIAEPATCIPVGEHPYAVTYGLLCTGQNTYKQLLFNLAHVIGPAVILLYGLVAVRAAADANRSATANPGSRRGPPPGLHISPINSAATEADTEPNVH